MFIVLVINLNYIFFNLIIFFSFFIIRINYSNILLILISLEFIILRIFMLLGIYIYENFRLILILYYLVFVICERVLGLTLLILLIRNYGNDNLNFLNLIIW